jgi:dipeptidyl aminopeptidase/acylaminoacyl peptidase
MRSNVFDSIAWTSREVVRGPITGVIVRFPGLGGHSLRSAPEICDREWGERGGLVIEVSQDPWGWMNDATRDLYDEVIDDIRQRHQLPANLPLIAIGGSMGGHASLTWSFRSRHAVTACQANCPVADLCYHYGERRDLPRTMHHAFGSYDDIVPELELRSPLHRVAELPDIPYQILHGDRDQAVAKEKHSDPLVAAMRKRGLRVEYHEVAGMGHCWPIPDLAVYRRVYAFVAEHLSAGIDELLGPS